MSEKKKLSRAEQIERFVKANAVTQDKGVLGHAQDAGLSLLSGAVSVPETAVGLADILSGGTAGKFLENQDGMVGFRPKEAKEAISSWKTERGQKQLQDFQEAEGIGAKFGQAVRNPTLVTNTVLESLPAMGAGGVVGRGLGVAAKGVSPVVAGAVGEGVVGAGMAAEAIRQQTDDGLLTPKQAGLATATGATTAGFGYGGGKVAQKLGLGDVDTMIVGGTRNASGRAGAEGAQEATNKGLVRRTLEAAATEGFLEELPQSVSEQVLQNIALENDIMDGVDEAAVLGVLSGGLMGGIAGAGTRQQAPIDNTPPPPPPTTDVSVRDEPPQGPAGPTEPAGIDNLNRNFYDQGRGPDSQGMRDVTPTAEPKDVPTDPLSAAANTAQNTDIPQLGFYGDRARDTAATDNAPVEPTPAEKMGLDETQGGLTAAAAKAVNSGASAAATELTDVNTTASGANTTRVYSDQERAANAKRKPKPGTIEEQTRQLAEIQAGFDADNAAKAEADNAAEANANTTASGANTRSAADKRAGELRAKAPYKMNQAEAIANNEAYGKDYLARQQAEAAATTGDQSAVKLTDENPTVNIPAPRDVTPNSNATEQNNNNNNNELQNSLTRANEPAQQSSADNERMAANTAIATGKDGSAKWFGREEKAQEFVAKKNISDTHEVVSAGKSRFEIQPKAQTTGPTAETSAVQDQTSAPKRSEARNTPVKDEAKSIGKAYTADNDEVPYQWDVVDAKDLVSSHTNTFGKNPNFPADAQPRDRANAGYQAQVLDIINKFNPEFLGESALASAGSPIIGSKDNVVESGNGRTIAIRTKYENGSGEAYRQFVNEQAAKFGLDTETVASMSEPVLVRRNLSDMDRGEFAVRANKDDKASMGSTEIARIDAKAIPNTDLIEFDKNGSMNLNASRKFTQAFTKAVGTNEAGNLIDKDGNISQTGKLRITGALLHNAYDSDKLTRAVTETLDPSAQNVLKVLTDKAPQINKIKQHVESGKRTSSTLAEDIKTAAEKYIDLVESGANIDLFLANNDLFSEDAISEQAAEIIGDFYANPRSATKIGQDLQARIDADTRVNDPNEAGLFGVEEAPPVPNNKKRSILRSKNKPQEVSDNEQPAESKQPKTLGAGKEKRTFIGKNAAGEMIYEDGNGIRSKRRGEFMASEPVKIQLGNDEKPFDTSNRPDDFKLERELAPTQIDAAIISERESDLASKGVAADPQSDVLSTDNRTVRQISLSYESKESRLAALNSKLRNITEAAENAGVKISTSAKYYQEAFNDSEKAGSKNPNKSYVSGRQANASAYNLAHAEVMGAIKFVENDNVAQRKAIDTDRSAKDSETKSIIEERDRAAEAKKQAVRDTEELVESVFGMSMDDIYKAVFKDSKRLEAKAKRTGNQDDQAAANKAKRKARQDVGDIEDAVTDFAKGDISLDQLLSSKAGSIPEISEAVIENTEVIEDTPAKEKEIKDRFANNTFFDSDTVAAARARIKSKMGRVNSGIDPEMLTDGAILAGAYIESGVRKFSEYAKIMIDDLGKSITPYLLTFWNGARDYPGFDSTGMTNEIDSRAQFNQLMLEYKPSKDMEAVLGEDKTQVKPKRKVTKPTNKDVMLRQDWGVKHIDGYAESDEFKGEQTDYGVSGGVKDEFLKDAKNYLTATKKNLESLGYTMALDRKGKPMKVNVNAAGPAVSGDVSLSMYKDGSNIHVSIGQSSVPMMSMFRDINADGTPVDNAPHPQQVAVMYRTSMDDGDVYATKIGKGSGNIWVSHKLTATELAQEIDKTSNNIAAKVNKLKDADYGVANIDDRSDADDIVAELLSMESTGATSNDTSTDSADKTRTADVRESGSPTQQRNAQDDTGNVGARESENDSAATQGRNTGRSIVRGARENVADNGSVPGQRNAADGREGTSGARAPNAGTGERAATDAGTRSPAATKASATDLLIENPLEVVGGTPVQRFNRNREALELMQKLEQEARQATPAEQKVLAGYIGWGSFGQELFQGSWDNPKYKDDGIWKTRGEWLRETLGESAWKSAQRSITNAHYTDPPTVMAMWSMVERMGFTGGRVLEPSMGTGNFFSMMPASVQARSQLTGIELDEATGAIAKQLFPQSNIQIMGYQDSKTPDNFYDVVIGNYPFENTPVADRRYNKLNPMLHDYFFLKSMDQVRPGGIVISITSSGTMDKQNTGIRRELAKQAELVAAIRLPSGAFKDYAGTEVVTDIVILRKRAEKSAIVPEDATWIKVADYKTPSGETIKLNQYYIDNPQNIIGTIDFGSGTTKFGAGMIVKRPNNMEQRLKDAINLVPENAIQPAGTTDHLTYYANATGERHGSIFDNDDGDIMLTLGDQIVKAQDVVAYAVKSKKTTDERESEIKAAIDLRRKHSAVVDAERAGENADAERKALKSAYNAFVKDYGNLRKSYALSYMKRINDPFYFELAALEQDDGKPATMMSKSTTRGKLAMENPSVRDAYVLARNNSVAPTLKEIAELTGKTESEIKAELQESGAVFEAPNGDMVPSDIYLSGNVRQKLREAQAALADGNKAMAKNVEAIKAVVPKDIPYFNIETQLGATWIPPEAYQDYIAHMLGRTDTSDINVAFLSGRWKVKLEKGVNRLSEAVTNYGTHHYPFSSLVQAAFSNQVVRITKRIEGEDVYDGEATAEANERIAKIRGDFGEWLWSDPERRLDLEKEYNEARNAWATPKYDGSFLAFEGMALSLGTGEFNLRQHQADAIWRAIVNRRSLNAHEVGTGKTFTMAGIAIESRRYGIAKKPVIFAHNANSKAVADEIRMMYPSSRVLYIDNLSPKKRDISLRQIANDDWDAIVLPHSLMDRMALTEDTLMSMAADDIAALEQEFREAMDEDGENASKINLDDDESIMKIRSTTAKELAKARKRIIETIKKQAQQSSREGAVTFEDLGIDMILVDEVHEFKKPTIVTRMRMKGLNTGTSQRSIQLQLLTRYVRQMNNGGNVHTFTGTPITNTLAEIYHQMRYVMDMEMQEAAVSDWDGWFGSFATEVQDVELSSAGDYEMVTRLAGFVNVPELRQMVGQYMDTVFAEDMPEMQPRKTTSGKTMADDLTEDERVQLLNGRTEGAKDRPYKKVINESADMTAEQKRIFEQVQGYAKEWRDADSKTRRQWLKDGDHRTPLAYGRLADTASFDARMLDPSLVGQEGKAPDNENSKTSRVVKNVKEIYDSHDLAGQVIFMDNGYNTKATRSGGRDEDGEKNPDIIVDVFSPVLDLVERLVQSGIPREQIAVVSGKTSKADRSRIAADMNTGKIRVVIGQTQTLGVGVNMQRNLRAMHHMDAPYMPGELEQRNGRGQRQGNQWNTVLEYRYMTDRLDGKRWQILAVKQRFITAFMKASNDKRSIDGDAVEESNDILESFSEAAGDPRILQRVKLQKKLEQLNSKERLYTRGIADMRREMRSQTNVAANEQASLDKINPKEVADILESQRENFTLVLGNKTYNKRADATDALKTYIKDNVRLGDKSTLIGSYAGTPLYVAFKPMSTEAELVLTLGGYTFSGKGLAGLESVMRNLPKQIEKRIEGINKAKASVETLKKAVTQPFMQKDELARVEKQIEALEADLELNPVPAPVWLRQGAPMDSEVFYDKRPFVVTGHQYSNDGYFVVAEDNKGTVLIPYLEAKDGVGMPLYDEQEFVPPEVIQQKDKDNPNNLTDADRVPDSSQETQSDDDQKFSRTGPVKGSTKTTPKQVIDKLASKFGKSVIDKLIANGTLEIKTLNDYVVDGELVIPSDVDGIYHQGKAILIADNLSDDMIIPTFLHELGGHGGLQTLMDKKAYDALMRDFDALVKAGDPMAMQAKAMADSVARNKQDALDEYLPYLITLASRAKAKQGKIAGMINRIAMAIRSWLRNTLGMSVKMNAQDVLALAERMVEARTQQPLNNIQSPINSFEGVKAPADQINAVREKQSQELRKAPNGKPSNLTEQQWLQVRTPAFKQWFGDWENDPANASKILDENGEPLVVYHGAKSDFWVFDMSRSVPQRNEGMMGMFFTDNAKTAAGYTVDLRKEAAVIKAKENLSKINNEFGFKRRQLEAENKTGDQIQELTKKEFEAMKAAELKLKAAIADAFNNAYDNAESRTKAVFVKSQMPFEQDADGKSFLDVNKKAAERYFVDGVYDGIVNNNVLDDANANHSVGAAKVVVSFDATNIKSATDNMGTFDSSNPDIRLSRKRYTNENQLGFDFDEPMSAVAPANQPNLANTLADPKAKQEWREKNKVNQRQVRTPSVQEAAIQYQEGEITQDEYIKIVRKDMPIKPMGKVPKIPTLLDIGFALDTNKVETGIVGIDKSIENDTRVGLRLDIPAYDAYDTWVVSIHDGTKAGGKSLAYAQTGYISNVEFMTAPKGALNIATGKSNKSTIARMHGDWINHSPVALAEMAEKALASDDWIEVGMNPFRHSWFYDKADGNPVVSADEVIQIGALVLARNAQKTTVDDDQFTAGKGSGMKFSRAAGMNDQFDPRNIAKETAARFHDWVSSAPPGKLSWWHKTVGTMYNLAQRNKFFKPVFDHTEKFINDVSFYAAKASELAPKLLPKLDGLKDITKTAIGAKDNDAISKPIFEGTLIWGRDLNGKAVLIDDWRKKVMATSKQDRLNMLRAANRITPAQEAELAQLNAMQQNRFINGIIDDEVSAGLVWTDSELRSKFNLSDEQITLYREFRAATDNSLDSLTRSDMLRKLGKDANDIEKLVMDASSLRRALFEVEQHINNLSTATPSKAQAYAKTLADIKTSVARTNKLIADGYAPLSRFGQYTVDVVDAAGNREYFGMFESAYDARKMAKEMADLYGADFVTQGTLSSEEFKLFAGVTPETAELFGEMLGLEATGDNAADQAFQEFLRRTKNNRSAMKRLMHRKGIKGYSEDVGRVLASFIYSNARHTSAALNMGNIDRSIQDIPKAEGQLKDAAVKLAQYIKNPQEEGHVIRGFMFAQYLGGSIASAMVNLTQPIAVSFPYLSQFGGAKRAAAELSRAAADWASKKTFSADLQKAIDEAEADGTLSPQEVHNLLRQAQGKNPLRAGDGTKYGDAKAAIQNTGSRIGLGWGAFFSLAEQINRRVTFVAAYRMAQDQGMANPAAFASRSIKETQFVYNKASRMQWGRGAIGGTLMTFKTYSVSYIELMHRLWTQGEKGSTERAAGRKAAMIMMATLFLLGGGGGLPFMEDIEDVIDGASQVLGYNLSTRKAREEFLDSVFGEMMGDFMESGISGIPGMPTDVSGRLGMDNLIPGTGVFKQRTSNTKDVLELAGPAGDFVGRVGTGTRSILKGAVSGDARQVGRGVLELSPVAVRNAAMGAGMLASGTYKDTKGYKVDDVTPIDAAFKALGFQPKEISKIQGQAWLSQTTTAYYNLRASEIRALWAAGISEGNKSKIADAQKALADWNKKNPSQIIVIRPTDIQRRVREMNMSKSDRVTKLAPKTMRAQIQDDFANARGEY